MAAQLIDDPTARWLMVVDTDQDDKKGIAFAKWNLYVEGPPGMKTRRQFGEGCNVEACEMVFGGLAKQRDRVLGERRCLCELS